MIRQKESNVIEMSGIHKYFPGVHALDNCQFQLKHGEVHALIGENGAGKSTLVKIMTGIYQEYSGDYKFDGKEVAFKSIKEAQQAGISIVHQELNMMNALTVSQNIFIGRESKGVFIDDRQLNHKAMELINEYDIGVKATDLLKNLSVGKAQMVEIARAMSFENTKVLILDEPTAALSEGETEELFKRVRSLKAKGVSIVFISHRLNEIMELADRVTVMRDGAYIDTLAIESCRVDDIIRLMVGRDVIELPKEKSNVSPDAEHILEVKELTSQKVKSVSFHLRKGEILGFAGLVGSGRTEVMRLICGADKKSNGLIQVNGQIQYIRHPKDAIQAGIGYLSEDRKRYGLALGLSVKDNTVLASYETLHLGGLIKENQCAEKTKHYVERLKIKTPHIRQKVKNLSGGNQQKVVIGKWVLKDVDILIFDEPTRGIDVGARAEIYNLMDQLVRTGKSIIMVSSDLNEILKMSDRIMVMCEGRITGELDIEEANQEAIMTYATNHKKEAVK